LETIRTYPDLSAYCIRERLDLPYRLWLLLRPAHDGRGWLTLDDIYHLSLGNRRQTRAWLKRGAGLFWTKDAQGRYWLAGLGALCVSLGVIPRQSPVDIALDSLESLQKFRATLFSTWFAGAGDDGRVISQAALSEVFGKTARTLYSYAQTSGLAVKPNMVLAPFPDQHNLDQYPLGTVQTLSWGRVKTVEEETNKPNLVWVERHGDKLFLVWGMPNTYVSEMVIGPKTTLQRLAQRKAGRALDSKAARANVHLYWRKGKKRKPGAIAKALQREKRAYFETSQAHPKTGAVLWHFVGV
jgi:hypothetical protein